MITTEQMNHGDMRRVVAEGYTCGECGERLAVVWGGSVGINSYVLRCHNSLEHNTINRHDVEREQKIQQIREIRKLDSKSLMNMSDTQMTERINLTKFPSSVTITDKKMLVKVALTYGFDPLMGELMVYQGRPFVTIDGRYRKAQETGLLDGVNTRPATKQEKEDWGIPPDDYYFRAEVFVKGATHPFVGWGRVRKSETAAGSTREGDNTSTYKPIQNNPQRMAEKRAEAQALRKAFSIPLPSAEDIGSPDADPNIYTAPPESYSVNEIEAEIVDDDITDAELEETRPVDTTTDTKAVSCTEQQRKKIYASSQQMGYTEQQVKNLMGVKYGVANSKDLTKKQASDLIEAIARGEGLSE
jgi:hypothetical protein